LAAAARRGGGDVPLLSDSERQRIEAAIRAAEAGTVGELVTVIAGASDDYLLYPVAYAGAAALGLPLPLWLAGVVTDFPTLYVVQLATLAVLVPLFCWRPVTMRLVPDRRKRACAARLAREQFYACGLHETPERGGVLLFVSEAEHYVEILADRGIDEKVPSDVWDSIVADFTARVRAGHVAEGFLSAIAACGALLAQHLPVSGENPNRLPDVMIEI